MVLQSQAFLCSHLFLDILSFLLIGHGSKFEIGNLRSMFGHMLVSCFEIRVASDVA